MKPTSQAARRIPARTCLAMAMGATLSLGLLIPPAAAAPATLTSAGSGDASAFLPDSAIVPATAAYGTFVDIYQQNRPEWMSQDSNPAIGVLHRMDDLWQPGESWNDGTVLNEAVHAQNIQDSVSITQNRTDAEEEDAYIIDRQHASYWMIQGLGPDAQTFREATNAGTTIPGVPEDAHLVAYSDGGNSNGAWADVDSELGSMVALVNTMRGNYASGNNAKNYYQYMRPFRWSNEVEIAPSLILRIQPEENAHTDGGFPSGHTNASYLAGYGLALAAPEYYNDLLLNAAYAGYSRVVAGMHSPLDVMGGRILATGIAGATASDPAVAPIIEAARQDAQDQLGLDGNWNTDRAQYQEQLAKYEELTTFGWEPIGETGIAPTIPTGAESLLKTRLPYLDDDALRWVLYTTATDSGYVLVDDDEGWGRLNLLAAANGFGAFPQDVTVTMDAELGDFHMTDVWRNDISGPGGLTKEGAGMLTLAGANSFEGGVLINNGIIEATLPTSLGVGSVEITAGLLFESAAEPVVVSGDFAAHDLAELSLSVEDSAAAPLTIAGAAHFGGLLTVNVSGAGDLGDEIFAIATDGAVAGTEFAQVLVIGDPQEREWVAQYRADGVYLVPAADEPGTDEPGTDEPGTDVPGTDEPGTDEPGTDEPGTDEPGTDEPGTQQPTTTPPATGDGNLPSTGAQVTTLGIVAVLLLGVGGISLFLVKRRRAES